MYVLSLPVYLHYQYKSTDALTPAERPARTNIAAPTYVHGFALELAYGAFNLTGANLGASDLSGFTSLLLSLLALLVQKYRC